VAPILEGKLETWKGCVEELNGPRKEDMKDFNRRYGLTRHAAWLAETPAGTMVVALHQGPGEDDFMAKLGPSQHEFDVRFKENVLEVHGFDLTKPPPGPPPTMYFDSGS
jgi:hypothetical protein